MGVGFIGSKDELIKMAKNEGHPHPEMVRDFGELLNWVAEQVLKKNVSRKKRVIK